MQRQAAGNAKLAPIIILLAKTIQVYQRMKQGKLSQRRTDITPHRYDDIDVISPDDSIGAVNNVAYKQPEYNR